MKLLLNENMGRSVAEHLRQGGHDVVWIGEDFAGINDAAVMAKAEREGRVLVTKDKDFGELAFKSGKAHAGIILLRLDDERPANTTKVLDEVLGLVDKQDGPFFAVASESGLRVQPLRPKA